MMEKRKVFGEERRALLIGLLKESDRPLNWK